MFLNWFTQSQSYIQFSRTTWAWFPLYSKILQIKHQDYTFAHKAHKIFYSHKNLELQPTRITLADLKSHQANHQEAQERPNLMVVVPSTPYMCSSSYSQAKMPPRSTKINQDLQTWVAVVYYRERTLPRGESHDFVQKNSDSHLGSRKHILYSFGLSENSRLNFPYSQLISPDLSEISRLKNNSTDGMHSYQKLYTTSLLTC